MGIRYVLHGIWTVGAAKLVLGSSRSVLSPSSDVALEACLLTLCRSDYIVQDGTV